MLLASQSLWVHSVPCQLPAPSSWIKISHSDSSNGQPVNVFAICESKKRYLLEAASQVEGVTVIVLPVYSKWSSAVCSRWFSGLQSFTI